MRNIFTLQVSGVISFFILSCCVLIRHATVQITVKRSAIFVVVNLDVKSVDIIELKKQQYKAKINKSKE
jgi:hypothetical protein